MVDEHKSDETAPELVCGALAVDSGGRILLVKSARWNNLYVIPGGHVEFGERIVDAVKREMKEETGLDVYDIEFIRCGESIFEKDFYRPAHMVFFGYSCRVKSNEVKLNEEAESFVWVKPDEALRMRLADYTRETIKQYLETIR